MLPILHILVFSSYTIQDFLNTKVSTLVNIAIYTYKMD